MVKNSQNPTPPTYYLYGTVLTRYGLASLNHGIRQGNKTLLQKTYWYDKIHSLVSSSAIRWALRFYLQKKGYPVNRSWDEDEHINRLVDEDFDPVQFIDDDIFGFALLQSAAAEITEEETPQPKKKGRNKTENNQSSSVEKSPQAEKKGESKTENKNSGSVHRTGPLSVNHGISLTPYQGQLKLGAKSGKNKDSTSLHYTEYHNTRYQYYFGVNVTNLKDKERIFYLIDGIMDIPKVGGNSNIFNYDFSPDSIVFRWTNNFSSHISYCFEAGDSVGKKVKLTSEFLDEIDCEEIPANELWVAGPIIKSLPKDNKLIKEHLEHSPRKLIEKLKNAIKKDLKLK